MAEVQQTVDPANQAGGGTRKTLRAVHTLQPNVLTYLKQIFETHAGSDQKWTPEQVCSFVESVQGQDMSSAESKRLLEKQGGLDFNEFLSYMTSHESAIVMPHMEEDLSWPLSAYFISSSHNTYLTGNQLSSESTTDAYTNVLRRGCRCVEIDVWDGDESDSESSDSEDEATQERAAKPKTKTKTGRFAQFKDNLTGSVTSKLEKTSLGKKIEDNAAEHRHPSESKEHAEEVEVVGIVEPRVLHGYTLTKEVSFRDVCVEIRKSAFVATDLPLIVSLEVHCKPEQQQTMVDIMKETWNGVLVDEVDAKELPSPESLRGKILIKVKYAPPDAAAAPADDEQSGEDDRLPNPAGQEKKKAKKAPKIIRALSNLGVYTRAVSFKSWDQPEATMPVHIFSLSEKKFLTHHEENGMLLFNHNRDHLLRAYPSGLRIGSSNLNPPPFWGSGAQIVALNWQQTDEGMMLNEGMFAGTGGYVLKPPGYRPKDPAITIARKTLSINVTFLAAQNIPLPADDKSYKGFEPYVKMELHLDGNPSHEPVENEGHERDGEYKAHTKTHRGRDIDLKGEKLSFSNIPNVVEQLSFVRFKICDDEIGKDDLAAWACVRLDRLGQGYRFIHLWDSMGTLTDGAILVKVDKRLV